jgi:hypothetical protein
MNKAGLSCSVYCRGISDISSVSCYYFCVLLFLFTLWCSHTIHRCDMSGRPDFLSGQSQILYLASRVCCSDKSLFVKPSTRWCVLPKLALQLPSPHPPTLTPNQDWLLSFQSPSPTLVFNFPYRTRNKSDNLTRGGCSLAAQWEGKRQS